MIMTLVPLVGAAATHYSHFDMIHYGSYVSALSPLWMALFTTGNGLQTFLHPTSALCYELAVGVGSITAWNLSQGSLVCADKPSLFFGAPTGRVCHRCQSGIMHTVLCCGFLDGVFLGWGAAGYRGFCHDLLPFSFSYLLWTSGAVHLSQATVCQVCKSCALLCRVGDCVICDSAVPWGVHLVPKVV